MKSGSQQVCSWRQAQQGESQLMIKGTDTLGHYMLSLGNHPQAQHITVNVFLALLKKLAFFKQLFGFEIEQEYFLYDDSLLKALVDMKVEQVPVFKQFQHPIKDKKQSRYFLLSGCLILFAQQKLNNSDEIQEIEEQTDSLLQRHLNKVTNVKKMRAHYRSKIDSEYPKEDRYIDYSQENYECECVVHQYYRKMIGNTLASHGNVQTVYEPGQLYHLKPQHQKYGQQQMVALETAHVLVVDKAFIEDQRKYYSRQQNQKQAALMEYFIDVKKKQQQILSEEFKIFNILKDMVITESGPTPAGPVAKTKGQSDHNVNSLIYFVVEGEAKVYKKYQNQQIFLSNMNRLSFIGTEQLFEENCNQGHYDYLIKASTDMLLLVGRSEALLQKIGLNYLQSMGSIYQAKKSQRLKQYYDYIDKVNSIKLKRKNKTNLNSLDAIKDKIAQNCIEFIQQQDAQQKEEERYKDSQPNSGQRNKNKKSIRHKIKPRSVSKPVVHKHSMTSFDNEQIKRAILVENRLFDSYNKYLAEQSSHGHHLNPIQARQYLLKNHIYKEEQMEFRHLLNQQLKQKGGFKNYLPLQSKAQQQKNLQKQDLNREITSRIQSSSLNNHYLNSLSRTQSQFIQINQVGPDRSLSSAMSPLPSVPTLRPPTMQELRKPNLRRIASDQPTIADFYPTSCSQFGELLQGNSIEKIQVPETTQKRTEQHDFTLEYDIPSFNRTTTHFHPAPSPSSGQTTTLLHKDQFKKQIYEQASKNVVLKYRFLQNNRVRFLKDKRGSLAIQQRIERELGVINQ